MLKRVFLIKGEFYEKKIDAVNGLPFYWHWSG